MTRPAAALAVILALALPSPSLAQTSNENRTDPPSQSGGDGGNAILGGLIGIVVTGIVVKAVEEAANSANDRKKPPTSASTPTDKTQPTKKTQPTSKPAAVQYRDVDLPVVRPLVLSDRPVLLDGAFDPSMVLIVLQSDAADRDGTALGTKIAGDMGLELVSTHRFALGGLVVARFRLPDGQTVRDVLDALKGVRGVVGAQPQYLYSGAQGAAPSPDLKALQYAPKKLNALAARAAGDGAGVTIGLIDTGIDLGQPELAGADIEAYDVMADRPVESRDHGTALAGLILARHGLDGIAPGARLVSVRAFDTGPDGAAISGSFEIASAIDLAVEKGARVLNLSFAGPRDPLVMSVLDAAATRGVVFVAAAGNGGPGAEPAYPGAHRAAIAVTATDVSDAIFSGANRGYYIAVAAPGVDVLSPMPEGRFELLSGTSIATAHVAAVVALMLEHDPGLTRDRIVELLEASAHDLGEPGHDAGYGAGLADAQAAIMAAMAE